MVRQYTRSISLISALALLVAPLTSLLANASVQAAKGPVGSASAPVKDPKGAYIMFKAEPLKDGKGSGLTIDVEKLTADPKGVSEKLYQFMKSGGYIAESAGAEKDFETRMKAVVAKWTEETIKVGGASRQAVAELVYVIDLGKEHEKNKFLVTAMKVWTSDAQAGNQNPSSFVPGQFKGTQPDKWAAEFLNSGAVHARKALNENRAPEKIKKDVGLIEEKPLVPVSPNGNVREPAPAVSDVESLYVQGADFGDVFKKGDKTARKISIKMSTRKEADGTLVDELRIYDLTKPGDLFYQSVDMPGAGGESTFALDDRQPGMRKYTLKMTREAGGDLKIVFGREGSGGEGNIETSASRLMRLRALQAYSMGMMKTINGEDYYVLDQGGEAVDKMYFPSTIKQDLSAPDTQMKRLRPTNMAEVARVINGRYVVHTDKQPDLGKFAGKPYHLEWVQVHDRNHKDFPGYFKVAEGPGTNPSTPPGGSTTTTPNPPQPPAGGGYLELEKRFLDQGIYELNGKAMQGAPAGRMRVYRSTAEGKKWLAEKYGDKAYLMQHIVVIPAAQRLVNVVFMPKTSGAYVDKEIFTLDGKYLVSVSDAGLLYMDLGKVDPDEKRGFAEVGGVALVDNTKTVSKVFDKGVLPHALKTADFEPKEIETALKNLDTVLKGAATYMVNGSRPVSLVVVIGDKATAFWPDIKDGTASDGGHQDVKAGNAYDAYKGMGPFLEFPEAPTLDGMKLSQLKKVSDAAVYVNEVPAAQANKEKPRRYYMLVTFNNNDQKMRTAFMNVFNIGDGTLEAPAGENFEIGGLSDVKIEGDLMTSGMEPRVVSPIKTDSKKGLYGMFATRASATANTKDTKANCLGPVAWWGMTKAQALEACKNNSY